MLTSEDRDFMDRLDTYLMSASVALKSGFYAEFAFKVTWENVSSADSCSESQLQTPEGCPVSANGIKYRRLQHRTEYYSTEEKQDRENSYEGKDVF